MSSRTVRCPAGVRTVFVRNIAARGLLRDFVLETTTVGGQVEVIRSFLPFFILARHSTLTLEPNLKVRRGFFDASFELAVTSNTDTDVTLK